MSVAQCKHEAWEDYGRGRRCADCREYLGPSAPMKPTAAELRERINGLLSPLGRIGDELGARLDAFAAAVVAEERNKIADVLAPLPLPEAAVVAVVAACWAMGGPCWCSFHRRVD